MAKEKKNSTIVTGFRIDNKILTGKEMYDELFGEMNKKFNPGNLSHKIIIPEPTHVSFGDFYRALVRMPDKKA